MPEMVIKNMPPELIDAIKRKAELFQRSLHDEVFAILREGAEAPHAVFVQEARQFRAGLLREPRAFAVEAWGGGHE